MKNKVLLISLALVLALSISLIGCGGGVGQQEEEEEPEIPEYNLTISSTEGGSVTTPGEGTSTYDEGEVVNLEATPDNGYRFVNWSGDVDDIADVNDATTTISMNGDYDITANFEEAEVTFADPNLDAAVREAIGKPTGPIYPPDLDGLTSLSATVSNITDLTGLEYCTNLEALFLMWNQIGDISPLANLTSLTNVALDENQISNISPLANLTSATVLGLSYNQITDVSPVANLISLTQLRLYANEISDISPLANLTNLIYLDLANNEITDISPLVDNEGLSTDDKVYLSGNPLNSDSINTYIPQLEARGVFVDY